MDAGTGELTLRPIGYVRAASRLKFNAPPQPDPRSDEVNTIELLPGRQFELALQDLAGFDRIWLVSWFDQNTNWRPRVLPPRGPAKRRGVFATRSPHRPNPIGLTCVPLLEVSGLVLRVGALDLIDGTPILDIKPYIATIDSFPESSLGWVAEVEAAESEPPRYQIALEPLAEEQLAWLREHGEADFTDRAFQILRRDPTPHRTRRIITVAKDHYRIACGPWRVFFVMHGDVVVVRRIGSAFSEGTFASTDGVPPADREVHASFLTLYANPAA